MAVTDPDPPHGYWDDRGAMLLWLSVLSGPAAWALNQLIAYSLVKPACTASSGPALTLIHAGALLVVSLGAWTAWSSLKRLRGTDEEAALPEARSYFMAAIALALNLLIAILILTAAAAPLLLSPCE
jgi:hypothetical protein